MSFQLFRGNNQKGSVQSIYTEGFGFLFGPDPAGFFFHYLLAQAGKTSTDITLQPCNTMINKQQAPEKGSDWLHSNSKERPSIEKLI